MRRDVHFQVGDLVYLKLRPYRQKSLAKRPFEKLLARFYEPFKVVEKIDSAGYKLELPPTAKIHPVFHLSQLKKALGNHPAYAHIPADLSSGLALDSTPAAVLGVRYVPMGTGSQTKVLIQCEYLPDTEATWEEYSAFHKRFPPFHLEGKVKVWAGDNAVTHPKPADNLQEKKQREKGEW